MRKIILPLVLLGLLVTVIYSCKKDKGIPDTSFTDTKFFALIKDTSSAHYYYKDGTGLDNFTSDQFGHGQVPYKLRMNKKASDFCTVSGKPPSGGVFPDSSLIIKELHTATIGDPIANYAAMYKLGGVWNWAKFKADGTVTFSITGDATVNCISCHNSSTHDLTRTFEVHP